MNTQSLTLLLSSIGIVQSVFLCFYLLSLKQGRRAVHFFLALILLGLSLRIGKSVFNYFVELKAWQKNLGLSGLLVIGPSVMIYGKYLLIDSFKSTFWSVLHYLPFVLFVLSIGWIPNKASLISYTVYSAIMVHWLCYLVYSWVALKKYHTHYMWRWYQTILIGLLFVWLLYVMIFFKWVPYYLSGAILYSLLIYSFSFLILKRQTFILQKYNDSSLSPTQASNLMHKLDLLMNTKLLYLQHRLTLDDVAGTLNETPRNISQTINQLTGVGFSAWVNNYRLKYASKLLKDQNLKISSVAYDSGFNSLTNFNVLFKKKFQLTPANYRANYR